MLDVRPVWTVADRIRFLEEAIDDDPRHAEDPTVLANLASWKELLAQSLREELGLPAVR